MTKEEVIQALEQLIEQKMSREIMADGKSLLDAYQVFISHQINEQREAFIADGGIPSDFKLVRDDQDKEFDILWATFSKHKKTFREQIQTTELSNLEVKKGLLEQIHTLKNEEHIKKAHQAFKEIESVWKNAGRVPQDKIKEIDNAYSKARDEFFYTMHIYRELFDNDLKKNLQLKEEIVSKMKDLLSNKAFKI